MYLYALMQSMGWLAAIFGEKKIYNLLRSYSTLPSSYMLSKQVSIEWIINYQQLADNKSNFLSNIQYSSEEMDNIEKLVNYTVR